MLAACRSCPLADVKNRVVPVWRVLIVEDDSPMRDFFAASVSRCDQLVLAASVGTVTEARAWLNDPANAIDAARRRQLGSGSVFCAPRSHALMCAI